MWRSLRSTSGYFSRLFSSTATMGVETKTVNTTERLAALRALMQHNDHIVNVIVVPTEDQHASEYIGSCDQRRTFISGFTGSAGTAVVTLTEALLFTDGRYYLQASQELDSNWNLMKLDLPGVPTWQEYISKHLEKEARVGIDPTLISALDAKSLREALMLQNSDLVELRKNLVDEVWGSDRPSRTLNPVKPLDIKYAGKPFQEKLKQLRETLSEKNAKAMIVTMLDEVAWLFNLRGSDITYNPVFYAYALVTSSSAILFVDVSQVNDAVREHLSEDVIIKPYNAIFSELQDFSPSLKDKEIVLIGKQTSLAVATSLGHEKVQIVASPIAYAKALKNPTEVEGFRQCHIRDGAALVRYFSWLEEQLEKGVSINESQGADKLEEYRKEVEHFQGLSFDTISSTGPNGAIIHYKPDPHDSAVIKKDQIYLCDSGGQYLDGTTDTTRTWHFGTPTAEEKRAFTRVLQGHIAIDQLVFPEKTSGYLLDPFARRPLWEDGLDYRHGTGHGVGHFLNVHEGPHGIGTRIAYNETPLVEGMTLSNEPGYYADGKFGVRIESIVLVRELKTPNNFGDKKYFGFEHVTMCPIHRKLVDIDLISPREREWLDSYHEETFKKVSPLLTNDQKALGWLKRECQKL